MLGIRLGRMLAPAIAVASLWLLADCSADNAAAPPTVASVTVTPGAPAALTSFGDTIRFSAAARDASGSIVSGLSVTWTSTNPLVATVAGGLVTAIANGTTTIRATVAGVDGSVATTVGQVAAQLAFTAQPGTAYPGVALAPAIAVAVRDARGNLVATATPAITVALATNPGAAVLSGTTTVAATAGVASFANLQVSKAGAGYTLSASAGALPAATSAAFTIRQPQTIGWSGGGGAWSNAASWGGVVPGALDTVRIAAAGTYTVTLDVDATVVALQVGGGAGAQTLDVAGRSLTVTGSGSTVAPSGVLAVGSGTVGGAGDLLVNGIVRRSGGTGTGSLGVDVTNNGTMEVTSGTLALTHGFSHADGAVLRGSGTLDVSAATAAPLAGDVNPGTSPGVLTVTGNLAFAAAATFNVEVGGRTVGTQYDQLNVSGAVTLAGGLSVTLINGFVPTPGDTFTIMTFASRSGSFATTALPPGLALAFTATKALLVASAAPAAVWLSVSTGQSHTCAVRTGGVGMCWGANNWLQSANPGSHQYAMISAGGIHTCGLTTAGAALCWGSNLAGELGNGTSGPGAGSNVPVAVSGGLTFKHIAAGYQFTCGVTTAGAAYCWGLNDVGELGDGSGTNSSVPVAVAGGLVFDSVSAGKSDRHACGITTAGALYCWGGNGQGQLGNGSTAMSGVPLPIAGNPLIKAVAAGFNNFTCALAVAGGATCWGYNNDGQLGDSSLIRRLTPVAVAGGGVYSALTAGDGHACAVTVAGAAHCWGWADLGQLGNGVGQGFGTGTRFNAPVLVLGALTVRSIAAGSGHTCAVTTGGELYCWGVNNFGQLGQPLQTTFSNVPLRVPDPVMGAVSSSRAAP